MTWMFSEQNRNTKRRFMSFIECEINGTWDTSSVQVKNIMYPVYRALHDTNCEVNITSPTGARWHWRFKPGGLISIEQSMLIFKPEDVVEEKKIA